MKHFIIALGILFVGCSECDCVEDVVAEPTIVEVERVVEVEKIVEVEKVVEVEKIVEVEKVDEESTETESVAIAEQDVDNEPEDIPKEIKLHELLNSNCQMVRSWLPKDTLMSAWVELSLNPTERESIDCYESIWQDDNSIAYYCYHHFHDNSGSFDDATITFYHCMED